MMNDNGLLKVTDLRVQYTSNKSIIEAVNGVSFGLNPGRSLALVGETGAGKTTIAKSILRILPDPPAKVRGGEIRLEGEDLLSISEAAMRRVRGDRISMVFQDPMTALNPVKRVGDQIAEVIKAHNAISKQEARRRAEEMLEMVGITRERYGEYPHQFSGGMKQRVIIAIALACSPDLLLADEPTTALDVTIQAQVLEMMNDLRKKQNTSMIMITHDLGVVAEICQKVIVMYAGKVVEEGDVEVIFQNPKHPYTSGLLKSIPDIRAKKERLYSIPGNVPKPGSITEGCRFAARCEFVHERCLGESPPLYATEDDGHYVRCFLHDKGGSKDD